MKKKIQNLKNYYTWEYNQLLLGRKAVRSKKTFKVKYRYDWSVARYKIKLMAQNFSTIYGVDFNKTFSPTMSRKLLSIFLTISCLLELIID